MRRLLPVLALLILAVPVLAQIEALKATEKDLLETIKKGGNGDPSTADAKKVLAKQAKILVAPLLDTNKINSDQLNGVVQNFIAQMPIQKPGTRVDKAVNDRDLKFAREFGAALVAELQPGLVHPRIVVRVNAARMLSIVAMTGYDGVVPSAVKIIENVDESEGVKNWALETLHNIFAFVEDPGLPEKSVFTKENRAFEHQAVAALCAYVLRTPKTDKLSEEEKNALTLIRRKAVRALGLTRVARVRFQQQVLAKPAYVLLKVALRDGITPPPDLHERAEAIAGFCQLFPVLNSNVDRDIDLSVASYALGIAMLDVATVKVNSSADTSIPWLLFGRRWEQSLNKFQTNVNGMQIAGAPDARTLYTKAKADLTDPMTANNPALGGPNTAGFRNWVTTVAPKSLVLFKNDPESTLKVPPGF